MLYVYDGTKSGFLTAFLAAFSDNEARISSKTTQLALGETPVFVPTDEDKAQRVCARFRSFDSYCLRDLDFLLRSGQEDSEAVTFAYFKTLAQYKRPIRHQLTLPAVYVADEYIRKVQFEIHRLHGFIRFMQTDSGVLYSPFSPDNDVCDLLVPHFKARLPQYPFVLHDVARKKAALYDGENVFLGELDKADVILHDREPSWQALFKTYYNAVNIPSRERLQQMRGFMPQRYWKFLTEKQ